MTNRIAPALLIVLGVGLLGFAGYRALVAPTPPEPDLAKEANEDLQRRGFAPLSGSLSALVEDDKYDPVPTQVHPLLNQAAPEFTLGDVDGRRWTLRELRADGPVVLVFYYGYTCNHCVSQLFGLNKDLDKFRELGTRVVAVSADPPALTRQRYERYGAFDFVVLSDEGSKVAEAFDVFRRKPDGEGEQSHGTFVIDRAGKVVWANRGEEPFTANRTLLIEVNRLRKKNDPSR
jgi:peroxiredoxin Q/BCP